jgi:chloramphenicol-sensitive protein RarD
MATDSLVTITTGVSEEVGEQPALESALVGMDATDFAAEAERQATAKAAEDRRGILMGIGAYASWGILPIYFKTLHMVAPLEMLANRIVWSLVFMLGVITWQRGWKAMSVAIRNRRAVLIYAVAAILLAINWYIYIWAVNANHILDASLGYFINPLMNVVLGVALLGERLRTGQWLSIAVAASGVAYLTWSFGQLPWVALVLASTFALYGVLKKKAPLPAQQGMALETATLFPPALIALLWMNSGGDGSLFSAGWITLLLLFAGPLTVIPLLMFAGAAKIVPLSTLGVLQYLAPTGQFLVGVFLYNESVTAARLFGFIIIWAALGIFWIEGYMARRARLRSARI